MRKASEIRSPHALVFAEDYEVKNPKLHHYQEYVFLFWWIIFIV